MNYTHLDSAFETIHAWLNGQVPKATMICGSGWSNVIHEMKVLQTLAYEQISGMGKPGVAGHAGTLALVERGSDTVLIFQGRRHYYEGEGWTPIALPIYISTKLGIQTMFLTNSAGGVRSDLIPGSLMIIEDHINNMAVNPLIGEHHTIWGPRFPDQTQAYDPWLMQQLEEAGRVAGVPLTRGVYLASTGPCYETPAEIKAYAKWGADAVGMSTLPEALLANAAGMKVAGLSCITNYAAGISPHPLTHEEVTETTEKTMPSMKQVVQQFLERIP